MSRADAFDAYYGESCRRLLPQVYAYAGSTEVAQRALAEAFTAAGQHWSKLSGVPDPDFAHKDAWIRERAFRASDPRRGRQTRPWYVAARETADEHRQLLLALSTLSAEARKLVILRYLVDLDLTTAAREVGVTDEEAKASVESSAHTLSARGIESSPQALAAVLASLCQDVDDKPVATASRLRREGNRRRRAHLLLAGVSSLALAVGAGAVTAAQENTPLVLPDPPPAPATPSVTTPVEPRFSDDALATPRDAQMLDRSRPWRLVDSTTDFGVTEPVDECATTLPSTQRARHLWVRTFSAGKGDRPSKATQVLEVAGSAGEARQGFLRLVKDFATCSAGGQLVAFRTIAGLGDGAYQLTVRRVVDERLQDTDIVVARTGAAVSTWVVASTGAHPVEPLQIMRVSGNSIDSVCELAKGECSKQPYHPGDAIPPTADFTRGFLTAMDLPLFAGLAKPWVATEPRRVRDNPAATDCDRANFAGTGAREIRSRNFVVPLTKQVPTYYGLTQTLGAFASPQAAARFTDDVIKSVHGCKKRLRTLDVQVDEPVKFGDVIGRVWRIEVSTSPSSTLIFRVGLLRLGKTVTQVTFTPAGRFDPEHDGYVDIMARAAQRLTQA